MQEARTRRVRFAGTKASPSNREPRELFLGWVQRDPSHAARPTLQHSPKCCNKIAFIGNISPCHATIGGV